ncbi:Rubrerythrin [Clostridiaceae bacterium JG1575]|nr:Rubrerythrin [Clostridiaceae bacterium JG1575]
MDFKDTKTAGNLAKAFAGESQARNRYTYYASIAKKEGFEHVAAIFEETAGNERAHAKVFFDHLVNRLGEGMVSVDATYPVGKKDTASNLQYAADGEREEWEVLYKNFGDVAEQEGFSDIALSFRQIAKVEVEHEKRYRELYDLVANNKFFERSEEKEWKCRNCGYIYVGKEALKLCPACRHPQSHFELRECEQ